jgi:serine protease Do
MRKFIVIGVMIFAALTAAVNVIFAQDSSDTTTTAWLGVALAESDNQVVIARVQPDSPADTAGLLADDVIVSFNGEAISSASDLSDAVKAAASGDTATIEILRDGESQTVEVTLGSAPVRVPRGLFGRGFDEAVDPLTMAERLLHADLETADGGYTVVDVLAISNPFSLEEGDIVTALNGQNITELDLSTLRDTMQGMDQPALTLSVTRAGEEIALESDMLGRGFGFGPGNHDGFGRGPGNRGGSGRPDAPPVPNDADAPPAGQA